MNNILYSILLFIIESRKQGLSINMLRSKINDSNKNKDNNYPEDQDVAEERQRIKNTESKVMSWLLTTIE